MAGKQEITKNLTLGEVVAKFPETVEVMLSYGLHCVGCHVAAFETIEQGALAHGMDEGKLKKLLKDMNKAIKKASSKK